MLLHFVVRHMPVCFFVCVYAVIPTLHTIIITSGYVAEVTYSGEAAYPPAPAPKSAPAQAAYKPAPQAAYKPAPQAVYKPSA